MELGDVVTTKSIEIRMVVEERTDKNGKEKPLANRMGLKFQPEDSKESRVGVFLYLGTIRESRDFKQLDERAKEVLAWMGWVPGPGLAEHQEKLAAEEKAALLCAPETTGNDQ
jgi:hypothetical protein